MAARTPSPSPSAAGLECSASARSNLEPPIRPMRPIPHMKPFSNLLFRPGSLLATPVLASACLLWPGTPALAQFRPVHRQDLPDFDSRAPAAAQIRAVDRASGRPISPRRPVAHCQVDFDPLLDSPKFIRSRDGFLTGPNGQGHAVSASALQAVPANDSHRPIKAFLDEHSALFGHGAEALDTARVKRDYVDAHNGLRTVVWDSNSMASLFSNPCWLATSPGTAS